MERKPMTAGDYAIATLLAATILVITAQVVWRYAFGNPLVWTEEAARYLFVWMIFLGAALAVRDGTHIRVPLLVDRLPAKARRVVHVVQLVLMILLMVFLAGLGVEWVRTNTGSRTPALGLPLSYAVHSALPITMALGVYYALRQAAKSGRGDGAPRTTPADTEVP